MRRALVLSVALAALAGCGSSEKRPSGGRPTATAAAAAAPVQPAQPRKPLPPADIGAQILRRTPLYDAPGGRIVAKVGTKATWGGPQILAVVKRRGPWLGVLHQRMPNGRTGWIHAPDAQLVREPWSIRVDLAAHMA